MWSQIIALLILQCHGGNAVTCEPLELPRTDNCKPYNLATWFALDVHLLEKRRETGMNKKLILPTCYQLEQTGNRTEKLGRNDRHEERV